MVGMLSGVSFSQALKKTSKPVTYSTKGPKKFVAPKVADFPGEIVGNVYQNRYFNMKIVPPESWLAQSPAVNEAIKTAGAEKTSGKTKAADKAFDEAVQRTTVLFTVTKDILGIQNNALMNVVAERMPPMAQVRDGNDYLRLNIQSFKVITLPPDFKYSEVIQSEKLGNETFYYIDIERTGYFQRFYAIARNGHGILFPMTYLSKEDLEKMKDMLRQSDFVWKG